MNWVPLSVMIVLGMPKRQMMSVKNDTASSERTLTVTPQVFSQVL
jgi:hypothetical protein